MAFAPANEDPQKQAVADVLHESIMANFDFPPDLQDSISVTAACIAWEGSKPVNVSGVHGLYIPPRYAIVRSPMNDMRFSALGECEAAKELDPPCTCQVVDEGGLNRIKVP